MKLNKLKKDLKKTEDLLFVVIRGHVSALKDRFEFCFDFFILLNLRLLNLSFQEMTCPERNREETNGRCPLKYFNDATQEQPPGETSDSSFADLTRPEIDCD